MLKSSLCRFGNRRFVGSGSLRSFSLSKGLTAPHTLAVADPALAANLDFRDRFAGGVIFDDLNIAVFEPPCLIWAQACIRDEQHKVMELGILPLVAGFWRVLDATACRRVKLFVFLWRKPRPARYFARGFIEFRQVGQVL